MQILDGRKAAQAIRDKLKIDTAQRATEGKKIPHLAAILVGDNGASLTYVNAKVKACQEVGFRSTLIRFEENISEVKLLHKVTELNNDPDVDGILVQLPLPRQIRGEEVINCIEASKDVDGFHPVNIGKLVHGSATFLPATPYGIILLLEHYKVETAGKHAVIIGRSRIVGRPLSILLSNNNNPGNCTVTVCHSHTHDIKEFCRHADIIVAALGVPEFVTADMVKEGSVVIDVGITREADLTKKTGFTLRGDVDFDAVAPKCSWITPVPGGVGPMTIAALLKNTFESCRVKN
ncbi:MAG TPA: tetrahydrofolate dehydrogenase/cyclohydrolase catalytic domain-containing protein [Chitinophagaceae bacterium]|nr:tetrahydrofolate dehydrogenase/cyclohydrolase catalytic domain-containing protein [Chitinophagaceae bacterium]